VDRVPDCVRATARDNPKEWQKEKSPDTKEAERRKKIISKFKGVGVPFLSGNTFFL